jgi:hypothetical protein
MVTIACLLPFGDGKMRVGSCVVARVAASKKMSSFKLAAGLSATELFAPSSMSKFQIKGRAASGGGTLTASFEYFRVTVVFSVYCNVITSSSYKQPRRREGV